MNEELSEANLHWKDEKSKYEKTLLIFNYLKYHARDSIVNYYDNVLKGIEEEIKEWEVHIGRIQWQIISLGLYLDNAKLVQSPASVAAEDLKKAQLLALYGLKPGPLSFNTLEWIWRRVFDDFPDEDVPDETGLVKDN